MPIFLPFDLYIAVAYLMSHSPSRFAVTLMILENFSPLQLSCFLPDLLSS